jgi:hypothetical protein
LLEFVIQDMSQEQGETASLATVATADVPTPVKVLMESLRTFYYSNPVYLDIFLKHTMGHSEVSLRSIDWFVTNFAKKFGTFFFTNNLGEVFDADNVPAEKHTSDLQKFVVHHEYKQYLRGYQKEWLDPFCRGRRIAFEYDQHLIDSLHNAETAEHKTVSHITTIGQLNFFKWVITTGILKYVSNHIVDIEADMNIVLQNQYAKPVRHVNKKGVSISIASTTSTSSTDDGGGEASSAAASPESEGQEEEEPGDDNKEGRRTRRRRRELSQSASRYLRGSRVGNVIVGRVVSF